MKSCFNVDKAIVKRTGSSILTGCWNKTELFLWTLGMQPIHGRDFKMFSGDFKLTSEYNVSVYYLTLCWVSDLEITAIKNFLLKFPMYFSNQESLAMVFIVIQMRWSVKILKGDLTKTVPSQFSSYLLYFFKPLKLKFDTTFFFYLSIFP